MSHVCTTCGRYLDDHYLIDGKWKCCLPEGSDISHLSGFEQLRHKHFWQYIKYLKSKQYEKTDTF